MTALPPLGSLTARAPARERAARLLSDALAPWVLAVLVPVAVGAGASRSTRSLALGVTGSVFSGVLPHALVSWGVRRGRWATREVPRREDRPLLVAACAVPVLVGALVLLVAGAPGALQLLFVAMVAGAVVVGLLSRRWKVSLHAAAAGGSLAALVAVVGPWALLGGLGVLAVAWARVVLGAHSAAQVVAGALVGAAVGAAVMVFA